MRRHEGETFAIDESWLKACPPQPSELTEHQVTTLAQGEKALIEAALAETHGRPPLYRQGQDRSDSRGRRV